MHALYIRWFPCHIYHKYTIYDRIFGVFPAINTVNTPYTYSSGQPYTQVYLLGRMGNASRALHLIIDKLEDIPQVRFGAEGLTGLCFFVPLWVLRVFVLLVSSWPWLFGLILALWFLLFRVITGVSITN